MHQAIPAIEENVFVRSEGGTPTNELTKQILFYDKIVRATTGRPYTFPQSAVGIADQHFKFLFQNTQITFFDTN